MFILSLNFVVFLSGSKSVQVFFYHLLTSCIAVVDPITKKGWLGSLLLYIPLPREDGWDHCCCRSHYQERMVGIPLIGLIQSQFCACPKPGPGFPTSDVLVFLMFHGLRWEVIVHFVEILFKICLPLLSVKCGKLAMFSFKYYHLYYSLINWSVLPHPTCYSQPFLNDHLYLMQ